jgi:DNA-directed RNA polymerase subunit RPC12/RpoP
MKLIYAYLCQDCEEIFDAFDIKKPVKCPSCTNSAVVPLTRFIPSQTMYPVEGENVGEMKELNVRVYDNVNTGDMECPFCKRIATDWCIIAIESVDEKKVIIKSEPIYLCISCWSLLNEKIKETFCKKQEVKNGAD